MLLNYLKITFRNLLKRKGYAFLNIFGLTIGMTSCLLIFHYVSYERSYDDAIPKQNILVRLRLDYYQQEKLSWQSATIYPAIAPTIKNDFPEVENYCRLIDANMVLSNEEKNNKFNETKGYYAEASFIKMFGMQLLSGNPSNALVGPDKMIISEQLAKKYFGTEKVLGKKLTVKNATLPQTYEITGVFKEHPTNSHLTIEYLASFDTFKKILRVQGDTSNPTETSFNWYDFYTYLQLKEGTDLKTFESKFPAFCSRHINWGKGINARHELHLIPVKNVHLYSNFNQEAEVNGNGQMVSFLFLIAIFIICIAWINYINLSTAKSLERAKEVGIKKVMGANRLELINQFLLENILLNSVSLLISLSIFCFSVKNFDTFTGRDMFTGVYLTAEYWKLFIVLFVCGTLLSGIYPAFILSGFQPVKVLKGAFKNSSDGLLLRKGLIVLQFVISVTLIVGTIIVYKQVEFMRKKNIGADIEQTLVLNGAGYLQDSLYKSVFQPFKTELLQQTGIKSVTASSNVMGQEIYWTNGGRRLGAPKESAITLYNLGIDYDFIPAYGMKLKAGRNFSKEFSTDKKAVILNEKAIQQLGYKNANEAINTKLKRGRDTLTIIGVAADYHHQGLQKAIDPMIILLTPEMRNFYSIKITQNNAADINATIEKIWNKYFPNDPYNYFFLDDTYNQQYKSDILFGKVFGIFALLAILIACLGLLALSAYNVLQRNKEIGVRKVLGATTQSILLLLSKDFVKLIIFSLLLAIPISWFTMKSWLQDFAYRINIDWWIFLLAGLIALLLAISTIVIQATIALKENSIKNLKTE